MGLIKIRKVLKKDRKTLITICQESFSNDNLEEIIDSLIKLQHFYVAEETTSEKVLGFVAYSTTTSTVGHILTLAVHPNYQRKGIGSALIEHVLTTLESTPVRKVRLEVRETNQAAIEFYQELGFIIAGKIENYYERGSDAFLMVKEVPKQSIRKSND